MQVFRTQGASRIPCLFRKPQIELVFDWPGSLLLRDTEKLQIPRSRASNLKGANINLKMLRQLLLSEKLHREDLATIGSQSSSGNEVAMVLVDLCFKTPDDPIFKKEWWPEAKALLIKTVLEEGTGEENHYMACLMPGVDKIAHGQVAIDRGSAYSNKLFLNVEGSNKEAHKKKAEGALWI